jgi:hypothetical protein
VGLGFIVGEEFVCACFFCCCLVMCYFYFIRVFKESGKSAKVENKKGEE